jgi:hypothetical protein
MNNAYNFNLYTEGNYSLRAHFKVPLSVLYIQVWLYMYDEPTTGILYFFIWDINIIIYFSKLLTCRFLDVKKKRVWFLIDVICQRKFLQLYSGHLSRKCCFYNLNKTYFVSFWQRLYTFLTLFHCDPIWTWTRSHPSSQNVKKHSKIMSFL